MLERYLPYLVTIVRSRLRGHFTSPGQWVAAVFISLALAFAAFTWKLDPEGLFSDGVHFLVLLAELAALEWALVVIGIHTARERDRGTLQCLSVSALNEHQILVGLVLGPATVELAIAVIAVLSSVGWFIIEPQSLFMSFSQYIELQVGLFLGALFASLVVVYIQLPRYRDFHFYRLCLGALAIGLGFYGVLMVMSSTDRAENAMPWQRIVEGLRWSSAGAFFALVWALTIKLLRGGQPLSNWIVMLRLVAAPAMAGVVLLIEDIGLYSSDWFFTLLLPVLFGITLFGAAATLWDQDASPTTQWTPARVRWIFAGSLALASAILYAACCGELPQRIFNGGSLVLGCIGRLVIYYLLLEFVRKRSPRWQPAVLLLWFVISEAVVPGCLFLIGNPFFGAQALSLESVIIQSLLYGGMFASSNFGHAVYMLEISEIQPWFSGWVLVALALCPGLMIAFLGLLAKVLGLLRRASQSRTSATVQPKSVLHAPASESLSPIRVLNRVSPLCGALALRSRRRVSVLVSPVKAVAFFAVLVAFLAMMASLYRNPDPVSAGLVRVYGLWLLWPQYGLLAVSLVAMYATMRKDRHTGMLQLHVNSRISTWDIATGYQVGAALSTFMLALLAGLPLVVLGHMTGRTTAVLHQQLSVLLLYTILSAVIVCTEARGVTVYAQNGPVRRASRLRPLGGFLFLLIVALHGMLLATAYGGAYGAQDALAESLAWERFVYETKQSLACMWPNSALPFRQQYSGFNWTSVVCLLSALVLAGMTSILLSARRFRVTIVGRERDRWLFVVPALFSLTVIPASCDVQRSDWYIATIIIVCVSVFGYAVRKTYCRCLAMESLTTVGVTRRDMYAIGALAATLLLGLAPLFQHAAISSRVLVWGPPLMVAMIVVASRFLFYSTWFRFLWRTCYRWRYVLSTGTYFVLEFLSGLILLAYSDYSSGLFSALAQSILLADLAVIPRDATTVYAVSLINVVGSLVGALLLQLVTRKIEKRRGTSPFGERPNA